MNDSEELAFTYLTSLGLSPIIHEPDGNIPPDFLANGRIAIEVRRLNRNRTTNSGGVEGLESSQFALLRCVKELLPTLGPPKTGQCWFVSYGFSRPLLALPKLRIEIRDTLVAFRDGQTNGCEFSIFERFSLKLTPASMKHPDCFLLGGYQDHDSGGWLVPDLELNIRICVEEKTGKIAKVRAKYPEWWLVLIDRIGYGERESLNVIHDWDKVILVNPLNAENGYEI